MDTAKSRPNIPGTLKTPDASEFHPASVRDGPMLIAVSLLVACPAVTKSLPARISLYESINRSLDPNSTGNINACARKSTGCLARHVLSVSVASVSLISAGYSALDEREKGG